MSADGAIRVLLVDEDEVLVRSLERVLSLQGFQVHAALDGRTALERLKSGDYDVMLMDLRVGSMDGMDVYAAAPPDRLPATIIHSAHMDVRTAVQATRAGVQDVMQKPVAEDVLASRIRELAAERRAALAHPVRARSLPPKEALLGLIGSSPQASELRAQVRRVARFRDVSVMVQGPTGTGKELIAQAVHALTCPSEPFVTLNCAAIPEQLFESELFGHEAGAFTSARAQRVGLLEEAGSGTLFLDEIGEMPLTLQAKLLRVLEVRQFRRVGGTRTHLFAARVVSATNRPLTPSLGGALRSDLFYRLTGYVIRKPTLAERMEDLPELVQHFLECFGLRHDVGRLTFSQGALDVLGAYHWPGNVRELRSVVENAAMVARDGRIERHDAELALATRAAPAAANSARASDAPVPSDDEPPTQVSGLRRAVTAPVASRPSLPDLERDMILRAFAESQQNLSKAALGLGIPRSTLRARLKRYGAR